MPRRSAEEKPRCPRCGAPVSWFEKQRKRTSEGVERVYLIAVHYEGLKVVGGKKRPKLRKCYLGPVDAYLYVTKTHAREGLILKGLGDEDRALDYLRALIRYFEAKAGIEELGDPRFLRRLANSFRELADRLERIAERIEEMEREGEEGESEA